MKIFLDFDDVLFNTKLFTENFQAVYQEFGISSELFRKTYEEVKKEYGERWIGYSSHVHIPKLQEYCVVEEQKLRDTMADFLADTSYFVFPDVRGFLQWCQKQGYHVSILSYGDREFQTQKIQGAKLSGYIQNSIVTDQEKSQAIVEAGIALSEEVWFFDDRLYFLEEVKEVLPRVHTVLVARPEGRYTEEESGFYEYRITSFQEGREILEECSPKS